MSTVAPAFFERRSGRRQGDIPRIGISDEIHVVPSGTVHEMKCVAAMCDDP
jgi:hypothetical protein